MYRFVCHHCPNAVEYASDVLTEDQALFLLQLRCWRVLYFEHTQAKEFICYECLVRTGEIQPFVKPKGKPCKVCRGPLPDCGCRSAA